MRKQRFIFGLLVSVAVVACTGEPDSATVSSSGDAKPGGGSLHIDSIKATGTTGNTSAKFSVTDTTKRGLSPYPADSLNKKKP